MPRPHVVGGEEGGEPESEGEDDEASNADE